MPPGEISGQTYPEPAFAGQSSAARSAAGRHALAPGQHLMRVGDETIVAYGNPAPVVSLREDGGQRRAVTPDETPAPVPPGGEDAGLAAPSVHEASPADDTIAAPLPGTAVDAPAPSHWSPSTLSAFEGVLGELAMTTQAFSSAYLTDGAGVVCSVGVEPERQDDVRIVSLSLLRDTAVAHRVLHGGETGDVVSFGSSDGGHTVVLGVHHDRAAGLNLWISARAVTLGVLLVRANMAIDQIVAVLDSGEE